jgi:hypothetical protein
MRLPGGSRLWNARFGIDANGQAWQAAGRVLNNQGVLHKWHCGNVRQEALMAF